ncbi:glycoside hydrolase family protein [Oscillochloris trichoides DG-6]|uniref:Glycoside hydrolase family protein n=1 Tax=Oscillochloris trichoides DG-6 TaxID=765420 RepID=E1IBD4_9CHLR|nr:glycosyl hydrolase family 18 protein [Oscillochloris trichoides]EFO81491.1 glycoside hydrolase family protein [Oscillochloris trichoides DG-6]
MKLGRSLSFTTILLSVIYIVAILVAGALIAQTLIMARSIPLVQAAGTPEVLVVTPTPVATAAPLIILPTPVPPTPLPTATDLESPPMNYHPKSGRYIVVWLPSTMSEGARASFEANKDIIDDISPFWYSTDSSGRLYGARNDELVQLAHANNVRVIPSVHNVTSNPDSVVPVLRDPQRRALHIQNIVDEVLARNYDGIDIDYEALSSSLRDDFSAFIRDLGAALHAHGKLLTIAVHAKDSDYGGMGGFQDWAEIGQHVDQLRIMTYDYHWRGGSPGPVAPAYWIESVTAYARSVVDPAKVLVGVHFYGYDWPPNGPATPRSWSTIQDIINEQGATVNFMESNAKGRVEESYFSYSSAQGTRQVWFMTQTGLASKIQTVQDLDLAGIAIWQLGYEKPEYWETVRQNMVEDPTLIQRALNPLIPDH